MPSDESILEFSNPAPDDPAGGDAISTMIGPEPAAVFGEPVAEPSSQPGSEAADSLPPPALPTDKTVISKRPTTIDAAMPLLPTPQSLGETLVGKKFGHYELVEFVGGGGMGAVFRANDTSLSRIVAVKVLSRDHTDEETIRRFRNEAQSAARLDHPNIARVYYVGEHEGWNFIVFEFIEGINLKELVDRQGALSVEDALNYTLQVTEALDHASSRDVVHRDIKPSNLLLTPGGQIKLVDMGLARLHQVESSSDDLTASGVTLGTFDYISPEQARDPRMADVRSDIYSLGCTLYFMLAARPPFPDGTALQKLLRHNGDDPPDPRLFRPDLPVQVIRLLEKMLAKRPAQRPQTPRELMLEILALGDDLGIAGMGAKSGVITVPPPLPRSLWSQALPIVVPIALLAILLTIVNAFTPGGSSHEGFVLRPKFADEKVDTANPKVSKATSADPATSKEGTPGGKKSSASGNTKSVTNNPPDPSKETPKPAELVVPADDNPGGAQATDVVKNIGSKPAGGAEKPSLSPEVAIGETPPESPSGEPGSIAVTKPTPKETSPSETGAKPSTTPAKVGDLPKPEVLVTKIVVRPASSKLPALSPEQEGVSSLARACQRALELGIHDIELQFDGELVEQPFELSAARPVIRAASGFKPVIVFRPQQVALQTERQMIRIATGSTGRVSFQGLELRMELPSEPSSGWALFALYQMQLLELTDCVLTVKDSGASGVPVQDQVAMLAFQPRRITDTMKMMDDEMKMVPPMSVQLTRCVARGEATFISAMEESPLKVVWTQGLLVTNQRLIETGGTPLKPSEFGRLELDLNHVTAVIPQGLYSMKRRAGNAHQLNVDVRCRNSLLLTDPDSPLFEFTDLPALEDVKLVFGGEGNYYPRSGGLFLKFNPFQRNDPVQKYEFGNRGRWSTEQRPLVGIAWREEPPASDKLPAHERAVSQYLLDPDAAIESGFDPAVMPEATTTAVVEPTPKPPTVELPAATDEPSDSSD